MGYRWDQPAYSLSYANRRRLEIARATATKPRLLLLDEPAAGMNPVETHEITELISRLREEAGYTILVIEHDMHVVEGISDRVVALDHGVKIAEGSFEAVATERAGRRGVPRPAEDGDEVSAATDERRGPLLRLSGDRHLLRADPHPAGDRAAGRRRRARLPARRQRVGQVDDAEDDPRARRAATRQRRVRRRGRDPAADELPHPQGHGDRAREPAAVRADDGAREPEDGRLPPRRRRSTRTTSASTRSSRASTSAGTSSPGRCRAASSRWWRWGAR